MPRDSSGNYTLPTGNPVITGSIISSTWANTTMTDIATEMTDSLDRSGKGGMLAPLKFFDGSVTLPGIAFATEPASGIYRIGANQIGVSVNGALKFQFNTGSIYAFQPFSSTAANTSITVVGVATGSSPDVLIKSNTTNFIGLRIGSAGVAGALLDFLDGQAGNHEWQWRVGRQAVGVFDLYDATSAKSVLAISTTDLITINFPTTIANLTANVWGLTITAPSTAGQSLGLQTVAGTNISDYSLNCQNQAGTVNILQARGDGNVLIYDRVGALVDAGYKSAPVISTGVNRTCVATDAGKSIQCTAALTITLNSAVFNAGDIVILVAVGGAVTVSGSATITWATGGSVTGSRTITNVGFMSVYWKDSSNAYVTGSGIS